MLVKRLETPPKSTSTGVAGRCWVRQAKPLYPAFFQKVVPCRTTLFSLVIAVIILHSYEFSACLSAVQPFEESISRDNDSAMNNVDLREALFLHQLVCAGTSMTVMNMGTSDIDLKVFVFICRHSFHHICAFFLIPCKRILHGVLGCLLGKHLLKVSFLNRFDGL